MKIIALLLPLLLVACSKPSENNPNGGGGGVPTMQLSMAPVTINLSQVGADVSGVTSDATTSLVWTDTIVGATNTQVITFMAKTAINPFNKAALEALQIFKLKATTCGTSLLRNRSCTATLEFKPTSVGPASETLTISPGASWLLSASALPVPVVVPTSAGLTISPLNASLGDFTGAAKTATISITNSTTSPKDLEIDYSALNKFIITSNSCPADVLAGRRVCQIKVSYTSAELLDEDAIFQENIIVNGDATVALSVTHKAVVQEVNGPFSVSPVTLDLGALSSVKTQKFTFSNATTSIINNLSLSSLPPGVSVVSNTCTATLARARICAVELKFNNALMFNGPFVMDYSLSNATSSAKTTISAVVSGGVPLSEPCSLANAQTNQWNISNAATASGDKFGSDVSACVVATCASSFSLDNGGKQCVPTVVSCLSGNGSGIKTWAGSAYGLCSLNDCDENYALAGGVCSPIVCSVENAGILNATQVSGTKVSGCQATQCSSNYEVIAGACSEISCTVANAGILNAAIVTGTKVSGCVLQSCVAEYDKVGNACSPTACTTANAQGNGVDSISNVASVTGTINNDSCLVSSCGPYHKVSANSKSCGVELCSELDSLELSTLGYNLSGATISGSYPSCSVSCTSPLQQLAVDLKSCEDKLPSGTILFDKDYTKILTPNRINITSTNAQQLQFYSDAGCLSSAGAPISLPAVFSNLSLSPLDGTKNAYAKFINGSKESACLTDTIILDQTLPALSVTFPVNNASIAGSSLTIAGTCSDLNPSTLVVQVKLDGVSQNANCSSGSFTSTFNINSLVAGPYAIELTATDLAENTQVVSSSFNKIICSAFQDLSGNSCVDKTPTVTALTINNKNAAGYVKDNNLQLSITGTNAQQMRFSFSSNCSAANYEAYSATKTLNLVTFNSSQQVYVQLKNGSLETSCFSVGGAQTLATSSVYVHDSLAPALNITAPVANSSTTAASVTVSGACTVGTSVFVSEVSLAENTTACTSSAYSYSLALSAATGTKNIQARQLDLAGNQTLVTVSISKTGPPEIPAGFECQTSSNNYPHCRWDVVAGATSYKLYSSTTLAGTYTLGASPTSNSGVVLTNNSTGSTYYYKIASVNASGDSALSSAVGVTNLSYQNPSSFNQKNTAKGYITSESLTSVNVAWDNTMEGATQYKIGEHSVYPSYIASPAFSYNVRTPISSATYSSAVSSATFNLSLTSPTWISIEGINVIGTNTSRRLSWIGLKKAVGSLLFTRNFTAAPTVQTGETFFDTGITTISATGLNISEAQFGSAGYKRDFSTAGDSYTPLLNNYYTVRLTFNTVVSANNGSYLNVVLGNQNNATNIVNYPFSQLLGKTSIDFHVQSTNSPMTLLDQIWITAAGSYDRNTQRSSMRITKVEIFD